jgi:hypothetical protein
LPGKPCRDRLGIARLRIGVDRLDRDRIAGNHLEANSPAVAHERVADLDALRLGYGKALHSDDGSSCRASSWPFPPTMTQYPREMPHQLPYCSFLRA